MRLPGALRSAVEDRLRCHIESTTPVAGGCINHGARVDTDGGSTLFVKWSTEAPEGLFPREAEGLATLRGIGHVVVPEPIAWHDPTDHAPGWLVMEYVEPSPGREPVGGALGHGLARLHDDSSHSGFGWDHDNWIGSLVQSNRPSGSWGAFWRDERLTPQLGLARSRGWLHDPRFDRVLEVTPGALADVTAADVVHGDLWSGNAFTSSDGRPVVIDPAVYAGHGEVDLAMSELFGGFGPDFYEAYGGVRPITHAYAAYRRALYQLYYLLVHVNLFGGSYVAGARDAAQRVLAELT